MWINRPVCNNCDSKQEAAAVVNSVNMDANASSVEEEQRAEVFPPANWPPCAAGCANSKPRAGGDGGGPSVPL